MSYNAEMMQNPPINVSVSEKVQNLINGLKEFNFKKIEIKVCEDSFPEGYYMAMFANMDHKKSIVAVEKALISERERCEVCNTHNIDALYSYLIDKLREKELLEDNFRKMCCMCREQDIERRCVW